MTARDTIALMPCPFGAKQIADCEQAMAWEKYKASIKKHLAEARALEAEGARDA